MKQHRFWAWGAVICMGHGDDYGLQTQIKQKGKISMMKHYVRLACFVGGTLFAPPA